MFGLNKMQQKSLEIPSTYNWDFKMLHVDISDNDLSIIKSRVISVEGDCEDLVPINHNYVTINLQEFDDFYLTLLFNNLKYKEGILIEVAKLNNKLEPIFKYSYSNCKLVKSESPTKFNMETELYGKMKLYFEWENRDIIKI